MPPLWGVLMGEMALYEYRRHGFKGWYHVPLTREDVGNTKNHCQRLSWSPTRHVLSTETTPPGARMHKSTVRELLTDPGRLNECGFRAASTSQAGRTRVPLLSALLKIEISNSPSRPQPARAAFNCARQRAAFRVRGLQRARGRWSRCSLVVG